MKFSGILILLLLVFNFGFSGIAQEGKKESRLSLGILVSPDYSYRTLVSQVSNSFVKESRDELEKAKVSYTTGLFLKYKLSEKFTLESGAQFSDKGEKEYYNSTDFDTVDDDIFQPDDPWIPNEKTTVYHYQYIDIPIKLNWYLYREKYRIFISAGMSANFFLNAKMVNRLKFDDREDILSGKMDYNFRPLNWAAIAGAGIEYFFPNRIGVRIEPVFRHSVTAVEDSSLKEYPYSFGINLVVFQ